MWSGAEPLPEAQSGRRWRRQQWWRRRSPRRRWALTARPRCTGSAKGCGSTTTPRCWRPCAERAVCAASTSWTRGSRPPHLWASTDGGEGNPIRGGVGAPSGLRFRPPLTERSGPSERHDSRAGARGGGGDGGRQRS